jgi:hypothetical protein
MRGSTDAFVGSLPDGEGKSRTYHSEFFELPANASADPVHSLAGAAGNVLSHSAGTLAKGRGGASDTPMGQVSDRARRTFGDNRCAPGGADADILSAFSNFLNRPRFPLIVMGSGLRIRSRSARARLAPATHTKSTNYRHQTPNPKY